MLPIVGYANKWSVAPGESIDFKVSSTYSKPYQVQLRRIVCADPNPEGPGIIEEDFSKTFSKECPSRFQEVHLGSYAKVDIKKELPYFDEFSFAVNFYPTLLDAGRQGLITVHLNNGKIMSLQIDEDGGLGVWYGDESDGEVLTKIPSKHRERTWYRAMMSISNVEKNIYLMRHPLLTFEGVEIGVKENMHFPSTDQFKTIYFASCSPTTGMFNGKLENPELAKSVNKPYDKTPDAIARWDFSEGISTQTIFDEGPHAMHGELINCPTRAVCGSTWTGKEMCWRHAPEEYSAIYFHDDDLYDCGWKTDFTFKIPNKLKSAMYAMHLVCEDGYDDIPFYVRPKIGKPQAKICVLIPTYTYTVYINQSRQCTGEDYDRKVEAHGARPWNPDQHQEYGLSTYNDHTDGSGICFSSSLRPAISMRPKFIAVSEPYVGSGMRHLPADTHLLAWLENFGWKYDVICDHDLHEQGRSILKSYQTVMTTSHPEYHTRNTIEALENYVEFGGRLMYLGGNGFYWKVGVNSDLPNMVEIRRAEGGIRTWAAETGEYYNALDGEYGGMWRRNGKPPQKLVGVGFTGQGKFEGTYYRRNPNLDSSYEWIFEGVEGDIIGDFGLSGGGAAGFELDRIDYRLGTPQNAVVLASSESYPDHFVLVPEEKLTHLTTFSGEPEEELIRADMVFFENRNDGAVFSVGSITYCGSLPFNNFDNNISKITLNVLRNFMNYELGPTKRKM